MSARIHVIAVMGAAMIASTPIAHGRAQTAREACWIQGDASTVKARPSALDSTSVTLDAGTIKVCYGRPSARGRQVMGQLVPYGAPWRLGANEATAICVSFAARIAGTNVTPGWYSLYVVPEEKQWRIVVNRVPQRWGTPVDDEVRAQDVGSAVVPVERLDKPVETLTLTLHRQSKSAASLDVEWENTRVRIPIEQR